MKAPTKGLLGRQAVRFSRLTLCQSCGSTCRKSLNPLFVEWLMGFEIGLTDFERWETQSVRNKRRSRSAS
jgi:hypothetical protein